MSISKIVESAGWKKFMAKVYGFGASVVLIGALFKLQHWEGANSMLIIGLSTEALIFFFSAFEPVKEEIDWSIVYPELAGIEEDPEEARERNRARRQAMADNPGDGNGQPTGGGGSLTKFDQMMENSEITPELFDKLGEGLKRFNQTAQQLNHVAEAGMATEEYVNNMQAASESVNLLTESYNKSKEALNQSIDQLNSVYQESANSIQNSEQYTSEQMQESGKYLADKMKESGDNIAGSYNEISENIGSNIVQNTRNFNDNLEALNKNLSALNSAYELELKATSEHAKNTEGIYGEMDQMMNDLRDSAEETKKYKQQVSQLNQNLEELNMVYGNMLSAMSVMSNS